MALTPDVVEDDGDVAHAWFAEFDDEANVRFWATRQYLVIQSFHSSEQVRGRAMLDWLATTYERPIAVVEATSLALGFWERMKEEGRVVRVDEATGDPSPLERQSVPLDTPWSPEPSRRRRRP